jgi:hypothetical protein
MKSTKAILSSIAVFVLFDFLISALIPDRAMNVILVVIARCFFWAFCWLLLAQSQRIAGYQFRICELAVVRYPDAANAATEIIEAGAVGWWDLRDVRLRNGQMGSPLVVLTLPVTRLTGHYSECA